MKRKDGYYWVRLHVGKAWVCALYREIGKGYWFMPGTRQPLIDDAFDFISADPIAAPNQDTLIWTPGN
jgi:hypothetical protein